MRESTGVPDAVITICYREKKRWSNRWDAVDFFMEGACGFDGSERERYETILLKLLVGESVCSDGID